MFVKCPGAPFGNPNNKLIRRDLGLHFPKFEHVGLGGITTCAQRAGNSPVRSLPSAGAVLGGCWAPRACVPGREDPPRLCGRAVKELMLNSRRAVTRRYCCLYLGSTLHAVRAEREGKRCPVCLSCKRCSWGVIPYSEGRPSRPECSALIIFRLPMNCQYIHSRAVGSLV